MGKKRAGSFDYRFETSDPDFIVKVVGPNKTGKIKLTAYAIHKNGEPYDKSINRYKTAEGPEDILIKAEQLKELVWLAHHPVKVIHRSSFHKNKDTQLNEESRMVMAFRLLCESRIQIGRWSMEPNSTQEMNLKYFERNFLPVMQDFTQREQFTPDIYQMMQDNAFNQALSYGKSKGDTEKARAVTNQHFQQLKLIYAYMRHEDPHLPDFTILSGINVKIKQHEQIKIIPINIHKKFRQEVETIIESNPKYARAAALADAGLRSACAAAVENSDCIDNDWYISVIVQWRENDGKRSPILKSDNAYRLVVCDDWASYVIERCNKIILEQEGEEDYEIAPVNARSVSLWIKQALIRSGCDAKFIELANRDMCQNPEYDSKGRPIIDIGAHMLRRLRLSIQAMVLGYSHEEISITAGHTNSATAAKKHEYRSKEKQNELALKNTRYDICPEYSHSPKNFPIDLAINEKMKLVPFDVMRFKNGSETQMIVKITADAAVCGETIQVCSYGKVLNSISTSTLSDKDRRFCNQEVIGIPFDYESIDEKMVNEVYVEGNIDDVDVGLI